MESDKIEIIYSSIYRNYSLGEFVLSNYFRLFKEYIEDRFRTMDDDKRRKIILYFQKIFDSMKVMEVGSKDYEEDDSIDTLLKLSKSLSIIEYYKELYELFPLNFLIVLEYQPSIQDMNFITKVFSINVEIKKV